MGVIVAAVDVDHVFGMFITTCVHPSLLAAAVTQVIMATNRHDSLDPALLRPGESNSRHSTHKRGR